MTHLLTMHRLFRRLQQKNRFIGRGTHSGLTIAETHFILELQADSGRTIAELAQLLGVNQSSGSRIAQNLIRRGLLKASISPQDSRRKQLALTSKGHAITKIIDGRAEGIIAGFASRISAAEMALLVRVLRDIGDGYGHAPGIRREGESAYRVEQRRITRCFGLLGEQVFESSFNSSQWQALSEIVLSPVSPQATELSQVLGLAQNSLSTVLESLETQDLIERRSHATDKRITILVPRAAGIREVRQIEARAVAALDKSLAKYSETEARRATDILRRFVGEINPVLPPLLPEYEIKRIEGSSEYRHARSFAARAIVAAGKEEFIPEIFIPESSMCYLLTSSNGEDAVFEFDCAGDTLGVKFAAWQASASPFMILGAIHRAIYIQTDGEYSARKFAIGFRPLEILLGKSFINC